jgi:hypothetical protein
MRKIVDSNYLRRPELREYLAASPKNKVVVTDYLELEMLGAEKLDDFLKSTEILAQYPRQIILAKTIGTAAGLRGKEKGLKKRLTDGKRTRAFRTWCRKREQIARGDKSFEARRAEARKEAQVQLGDVLENLQIFKDNLEAHPARYTGDELNIIRTGKPFTPELMGKLLDGIMEFAKGLFAASTDRHELPSARELPYTFIFRFALCAYLHALHWIAAGGAKDRAPEKFRNDVIDVALVAYGTCFDGLLTNDKLAGEIYSNASHLLETGFLREGLMPLRLRGNNPKAGSARAVLNQKASHP